MRFNAPGALCVSLLVLSASGLFPHVLAQPLVTKSDPSASQSSGQFGACLMAISVGSCIVASNASACDLAIDAAIKACMGVHEEVAPLVNEALGLEGDQQSPNNEVNRMRSTIAAVRSNLHKLQEPRR